MERKNKILEYFICGESLVSKQLLLNEIIPNYNGINSINNSAGEEWLKFEFWSEMENKTYTFLENKNMVSIDDLLFITSVEVDHYIIICACYELLRRENNENSQFRDKLIDQLEHTLQGINQESPIPKLQIINSIIYETELYDATNKKSILNKHFTQINEEAEWYKSIANRAKAILEIIKKY